MLNRVLGTYLDIRTITIFFKYEAPTAAMRLKAMEEWIEDRSRSHHRVVIQSMIVKLEGMEKVSDRVYEMKLEAECDLMLHGWTKARGQIAYQGLH